MWCWAAGLVPAGGPLAFQDLLQKLGTRVVSFAVPRPVQVVGLCGGHSRRSGHSRMSYVACHARSDIHRRAAAQEAAAASGPDRLRTRRAAAHGCGQVGQRASQHSDGEDNDQHQKGDDIQGPQHALQQARRAGRRVRRAIGSEGIGRGSAAGTRQAGTAVGQPSMWPPSAPGTSTCLAPGRPQRHPVDVVWPRAGAHIEVDGGHEAGLDKRRQRSRRLVAAGHTHKGAVGRDWRGEASEPSANDPKPALPFVHAPCTLCLPAAPPQVLAAARDPHLNSAMKAVPRGCSRAAWRATSTCPSSSPTLSSAFASSASARSSLAAALAAPPLPCAASALPRAAARAVTHRSRCEAAASCWLSSLSTALWLYTRTSWVKESGKMSCRGPGHAGGGVCMQPCRRGISAAGRAGLAGHTCRAPLHTNAAGSGRRAASCPQQPPGGSGAAARRSPAAPAAPAPAWRPQTPRPFPPSARHRTAAAPCGWAS